MELPAAARPPERPDDRQICCSMTSLLLRTVRSVAGDDGVRATLARSHSPHDVDFLECTDNWISLAEAVALLEASVAVSGDPDLPRRAGEQTVRQHAGTQVATLLRSLGSPEAILGAITTTAAKFSTVTRMDAVETAPGRAVVRATAVEGFERSRLHCEWARGLLSQPTVLFGLPPATVVETECQAQGGEECRYTITWDAALAAAAADPEQRVTALEAQVAAMAERLEGAYATASDLVSPDDVDTVLARIVERAANAVRAPGYVLAVRPEPHDRLRVFSDGLSPEAATRVATAEADETMLCVEVASGRRSYGRLLALHPSGKSFFPQEGQLLTLYARHAAAVLDTAVAMHDASRRHDHVSALLSLSQAIARAGTTAEVASQLVEAVVDVVDCDQAGMWIWDEGEKVLRREGGSERTRLDDDAVIHPAQTRYLERLLHDPVPLFFDEVADDPVLESIMTTAGVIAVAAVPIVARGTFLGLLTVSVEREPERLRSTPELVERLSGVAALAAPALQNGRLIDELDRQVVHDSLTGVLNRAGFGRSIEAILADGRDGASTGGLLFVDLDGFKALNDRHGHQAGDDLLCQAADRIRATLREDDAVARIGGDEFAVVLAGAGSPDEVHAAARRLDAAFAAPFTLGELDVTLSASVGEARFPEHGTTIDELIRHADAAMYREKALRRAPV
jgi:diguanylate cyclase (GGDEF)-like protein